VVVLRAAVVAVPALRVSVDWHQLVGDVPTVARMALMGVGIGCARPFWMRVGLALMPIGSMTRLPMSLAPVALMLGPVLGALLHGLVAGRGVVGCGSRLLHAGPLHLARGPALVCFLSISAMAERSPTRPLLRLFASEGGVQAGRASVQRAGG